MFPFQEPMTHFGADKNFQHFGDISCPPPGQCNTSCSLPRANPLHNFTETTTAFQECYPVPEVLLHPHPLLHPKHTHIHTHSHVHNIYTPQRERRITTGRQRQRERCETRDRLIKVTILQQVSACVPECHGACLYTVDPIKTKAQKTNNRLK